MMYQSSGDYLYHTTSRSRLLQLEWEQPGAVLVPSPYSGMGAAERCTHTTSRSRLLQLEWEQPNAVLYLDHIREHTSTTGLGAAEFGILPNLT